MQKTWVQSLDQEDPLERETATHSSILVWETPWTEEPGSLQSMGLQRVSHDLMTKQQPLYLSLCLKYFINTKETNERDSLAGEVSGRWGSGKPLSSAIFVIHSQTESKSGTVISGLVTACTIATGRERLLMSLLRVKTHLSQNPLENFGSGPVGLARRKPGVDWLRPVFLSQPQASYFWGYFWIMGS